jgi:polysaccharide chain length determinant protein (PEP-CTERM system associated)
MLPGKKYTPGDFLWMAWHRKWLILIPGLVIGAATAVWSFTLPNRYMSSTTILVVPQRVPENLVRSTVTTSVTERLQTIAQQIMSRTRLERIIEEFNLYREERDTMIMEDIIELMRRRDIKVDPVRSRGRNADATHFTVRFEASNPRTAMLVTDRLASMFVQENLQDREILADSTNQFLQAQLEDSRRRLIEHEARLQEFKQQYAGQLPTQAQSNLQMLQMTQTEIQNNAEAAARERDRIATLEQAIADTIATAQPKAAELKPGETPVTAAQQLEVARAQLRALEQRLKPNHPDIGHVKRVIANLELKADEEAARLTPLSGAETSAPLPASIAAKINPMRTEIEGLRRSLETRKNEDERLRQVVGSYASRIEAAPQLEAQLTELMRDYQTIQDQYTSLLRKSEDSKIAVNLERRQIGEQFKVIDGARLPERPFSPDRLRMNLLGLLGGLAFGLALVALLEYRDTSFRTDEDIVTALALPALAVIPKMISSAEARRMKRKKVVVGVSAASVTTVLVIVAVAAWRFNLLESLVR